MARQVCVCACASRTTTPHRKCSADVCGLLPQGVEIGWMSGGWERGGRGGGSLDKVKGQVQVLTSCGTCEQYTATKEEGAEKLVDGGSSALAGGAARP
jgi:hypothetical protein